MPRRFPIRPWLLALALMLPSAPALAQGTASAEAALLDSTFRIDIRSIDVTFDYYPDANSVDCVAHLEFVMRPGQSVPRFHFTPIATQQNPAIRQIVLDRQVIPFPSSAVSVQTVAGSSQAIVQIERTLDAASVHTLDISYRLTRPASGLARFSTEVSDMAGHGNEDIFPTLNTPHELARHRFALRVHGPRAFHCIGSGLVQRVDSGDAEVQQWVLDSEREVASYTLMFALAAVADADLQERIIHGIPVRILGYRVGASMTDAFSQLEDWLPRLEAAFGFYPNPHGLSVFLVTNGGGMEYYGGTISTPWALAHEVTHGYFACAVVMRTYRDSWLDEAIAQWFTDVTLGLSKTAIAEGYSGNWVGARSPVSVGYSNLAYSDGAQIIQYMADRLGGYSRMVAFLRSVYERYAFTPFTTQDFVLFYRDFSGIDLRPQFERWLYRGAAQSWDRTTPVNAYQRAAARDPEAEPESEQEER